MCRLQVAAELNLKDCTKLKYSPSGHLAAAATPRELTVFSTLTWTSLAAFRVRALLSLRGKDECLDARLFDDVGGTRFRG